MNQWNEDNVPDQSGKVVLVTGANSGIGLEASRVLSKQSAHVIMACRSIDKATRARAELEESHPNVSLEVLPLDLADFNSVKQAARQVLEDHKRLDILINNAGIMWVDLSRTAQGFEMQLGTNHLGHFALTGFLLPLLLETSDSRVVTVSSIGHKWGSINFDDLNWERSYSRFGAYFQSKLANLLFTFELQRRLAAAEENTIALAAHPGGAYTNLAHGTPWWLKILTHGVAPFLAQSAAMGALPTLRAATDCEAQGGDYYGPGGRSEQKGYPVKVGASELAHNEEVARHLWEVSENLTGIRMLARSGVG